MLCGPYDETLARAGLPRTRCPQPGIRDDDMGKQMRSEEPWVFNREEPCVTAAPPRRILVADDSPVNCLVARRLLQELGYQADIAATGARAEARHRQQPYDLILMDSQMAGMHGFAAAGRIRAIAMEAGRRVSMVACTTASSDEQRNACLAAGMDDVCMKPLHATQLRNLLVVWLPPRTPQEAGLRDTETRTELRLLASLFGSGFEEVVLMFQADTNSRLQALHEAAAAGNLPQIRKVAHALGGSCASMGGWRMAGLCRMLELHCHAGLCANHPEILVEIAREYTTFNMQAEHVLSNQRLGLPDEQETASRY
jgi:CheY-like chemotaxis protein